MAVFRIEKNKNYTVMANYHLRDISLSLKAKGLLSLMLSLPEGWDYTTKGLACICKDGVDSICSTVKELEKAGYVQRRRLRNELGHLTEIEYTILEKPIHTASSEESALPDSSAKAGTPPKREKPSTEAVPVNRQVPLTDGRTERERIREQIEYKIMRDRYGQEQIDELVEIMLEVAMNRSPTIRIGREAEYATAYVQDRFSRITSMHIERVCDGIRDNHTQVRNTKAYLLAALFNAVSTLDSYYTMQANSDFGSSF